MTENNSEILYLGGVCSRVDSIDDHIERHNLSIDRIEYLRIANMALALSGRNDELLSVVCREKKYRTVLRGEIEHEGSKYRIVRTLFCIADLNTDIPYPGYAVKVRVVGKKQPTYYKPDLPTWTEASILNAIDRLKQENISQGTYGYEIPYPHFIKIRQRK